VTRDFLGAALVPFDAPDLMQEADDAAGQAFGVGDAVAREAFAEVARLADIQDAFIGAAHQIDGGHFGERAEEVLAEPLDERLGRVEKPELPGRHAFILAWQDVLFKSLIVARRRVLRYGSDDGKNSLVRGSL
jgi:hypothetical protein